MHWLLIGYMFLFIDRPFEVWPILGDWHVERLYMAVTMLAWIVYPNKRWLPNLFHIAVAGFASAVVFCWLLSPWAESTQPRIEDWFKILIFYLLLVTTVNDEKMLKQLVTGFVVVMGLYLLHSFREYLGGRHTYRMGIARMIGVDQSLGDPNSFGASIVVALPMAFSLWHGLGRWGKSLLLGYLGLSVVCVLLTGSRSSFLAMSLWGLSVVVMSRFRWMLIPAAIIATPLIFFALPDSLQNRFETIINPDVGPANAKESGEGRIEGLLTGIELWGKYPISGVGPGAWRSATKSSIESHSLIGQLVGEMGTFGVLAFGFLLIAIYLNIRTMKQWQIFLQQEENDNAKDSEDEYDVNLETAKAVGMGILLLLVLGIFGHNLFRFSWLWYGGFLVIARYSLESKLQEMEFGTGEVEVGR